MSHIEHSPLFNPFVCLRLWWCSPFFDGLDDPPYFFRTASAELFWHQGLQSCNLWSMNSDVCLCKYCNFNGHFRVRVQNRKNVKSSQNQVGVGVFWWPLLYWYRLYFLIIIMNTCIGGQGTQGDVIWSLKSRSPLCVRNL